MIIILLKDILTIGAIMTNKLFIVLTAIFLTACSDSNSKPEYGADSNLPINCRAYIEEAISYYELETEPYEYETLDVNYYCSSDDWYSSSCQEHIGNVGEALEVKTEQVKILKDSLRSHCGLGGDLW